MPKNAFGSIFFNLQITNSCAENVSWLKNVLYSLGGQSQFWNMLMMLYPNRGAERDKKKS